MNAKKILFPTDFSTAAEAGRADAESLARDRQATLVVLHVQEPVMGFDGPLDHATLEQTSEMLKEMLRDVTPIDTSVRVEPRLTMGDPATEIVRVANEENVDMIVMGTHGRTGLSRFFMGSVAEQVIRHATCPVLTYRARKQGPPGRKQAVDDLHSAEAMIAAAP
jgi:universal stress protein A